MAIQGVTIGGLIFALCFQQVLFVRSREALEQKLLARNLEEYVEHRVEQGEAGDAFPFKKAPEEQSVSEEDDVYIDIDQMPSDEAHEAIMKHIHGR